MIEDEYGRNRWVVGYIEQQRGLKLNGRIAVQGPIKLVSFEDAVKLEEIGAATGFRRNKELGRQQTSSILDQFADAENIYYECVDEVQKYEAEIGRENPWTANGDLGGSNSDDGGC